MPNYIGTGLPDIAAAQYIDWVPIQSQTASGNTSITFTGMNSDFDEYKFEFVNLHPATQHVSPQFQVNAPGSGAAANFNETITSTSFYTIHGEDGSGGDLAYHTSYDQGQGTAYQTIAIGGGNANDESSSGILTLYAPSSTTYVKHFIAQGTVCHHADKTITTYAAGYINTTSAIDEINFKFSSGNTDAGTIYMYGLSK